MANLEINLMDKKSEEPSGSWLLFLMVAIAILLMLGFHEAQAFESSISGLKSIQDKSRATLMAADRDIVHAYAETTKLTPDDALTNAAEQTINAAQDRINKLLDIKQEESLRMDLIDKLIFKVSEKNPQQLKEALPKAIDEIILSAMCVGGRYTGGDRELIPFLMNLATALRTRREPIENPLQFVENYVQYSSILNPKPISQFRANGGYLNDTSSDAKAPATIDD